MIISKLLGTLQFPSTEIGGSLIGALRLPGLTYVAYLEILQLHVYTHTGKHRLFSVLFTRERSP